MNPFFSTYNTPFETVPFQQIKLEHYEPAFLEGIKQGEQEVQDIINNPEEPTFQNTIVALERSGRLLGKVSNVFFNLLSAETNDEMDELANKIQPLLSEHYNNIGLNEQLFLRIKAVYDAKPALNAEDQRLLEKTYKEAKKEDLNRNREEIAQLLKDAIVLHYYYRKGCIEGALTDDPDVKKAVEILNNPAEYNRILGK